MDIKELIERGETQSVEFKESQRLKDEIGETVSAFSNSDGGAVLIGVSNKKHAYQSQLRSARFAGRTMTRDFLDRLDCSGALWEMVEGSEDFVRKNLSRNMVLEFT